MRIGVNLLFLVPGEVGGTETYARELLRAMAQEFPHDRLLLFCNKENFESFGELAGRAELVLCPVRARFRSWRCLYEQLLLPSRAKRSQPDVLWSPGYTMPFRAPCPQVVTIHDLQYRHHPEDFSPLELAAMVAFVKISCLRADAILTASAPSADDLVRLGKVARERIAITPYGISEKFFGRLGEARARGLLGEVSVEPPYILTVANSYPHKNLDCLVRAFAQLERMIPHRLVIVGKARRGEGRLRAACATLKDPRRLVRLSRVSFGALQALYQEAALFVFPTLFEGFGLPVLEAMASGAPVACSDISVMREIAGEAAEFFNPRDAACMAKTICAILGDQARIARLRAAGMERARMFTWSRTARLTREALERAIGRRAAPRA